MILFYFPPMLLLSLLLFPLSSLRLFSVLRFILRVIIVYTNKIMKEVIIVHLIGTVIIYIPFGVH